MQVFHRQIDSLMYSSFSGMNDKPLMVDSPAKDSEVNKPAKVAGEKFVIEGKHSRHMAIILHNYLSMCRI